MTFTDLGYLPLMTAVFLLANLFGSGGARWLVLLVASMAFYAALEMPHLLAVLSGVILLTYLTGVLLGRFPGGWRRNAVFWGGVGGNIALLLLLKYPSFFMSAMISLLDAPFPLHGSAAAIGVSYYVFQAISYLTDVYLEIEEPEKHPGYLALYLSFFPKLLQGPIERAGDLIPQLKAPYRFDYGNVRAGLLMFAWGLFKKAVLADHLAPCVDAVYGNVQAFTGFNLILATYAYAIQLYCDFSGYTDMALGSAKILNIRLTQNFNMPYTATSIADFWRRWHISFSRWILDYIFKPLQMSLRDWGTYGTACALLVTFIISGIWHGASWGFVIWGLLHGVYLAVSVFYKPLQKRIHQALGVEKTGRLRAWQIFATFHLVCFAWIFFRASTVADAVHVASHLFSGLDVAPEPVVIKGTAIAIAAICLTTVVDRLKSKPDFARRFERHPALRWSVYYILTLSIICLGAFGESQFLYFRF